MKIALVLLTSTLINGHFQEDYTGMFLNVGKVFAAISFAGIGLALTGYIFWPEQAEKMKRQAFAVLTGVIMISVASFVIGAFGS